MANALRQDNYKTIIPSAHSLKEAMTHLKMLYGTVEGALLQIGGFGC